MLLIEVRTLAFTRTSFPPVIFGFTDTERKYPSFHNLYPCFYFCHCQDKGALTLFHIVSELSRSLPLSFSLQKLGITLRDLVQPFLSIAFQSRVNCLFSLFGLIARALRKTRDVLFGSICCIFHCLFDYLSKQRQIITEFRTIAAQNINLSTECVSEISFICRQVKKCATKMAKNSPF